MSFLGVSDPNWSADSGGGGKGAQEHYALASVQAVAASMRMSPPWSDDGAGLLWMWATSRAVITGNAYELAHRLGFRPCAGWVWAKVDVVDITIPSYAPPARMGLGQWQRCEHEHLILCRRGDVSVPPPAARSRSMIYAPRGEHSAKPDEAWSVIETVSSAVLPDVVGTEWNARKRRPGWGAYGRLDGEDQPPRWEKP